MSVLGTLIRLDKSQFDDISASADNDGFAKLMDLPEPFDLDRDWDVVRFLFDRGGAPVNPISGGVEFPGRAQQWSQDGPARCLSPLDVAAVHRYLAAVPFDDLARYLPEVAVADPPLYPENRDWLSPTVVAALRELFGRLLEFFERAVEAGNFVVFLKE